jgi:hypothetical protein
MHCCGRLHRGPSIYCSLECSIADWSALGACPVLGKADETADMAKTTLLTHLGHGPPVFAVAHNTALKAAMW